MATMWVAVGKDLSGNNIQYASDPSGSWTGVQAFGIGSDNIGAGIAYGQDSDGNTVWVAVGFDPSGNTIQYASDPSGPWSGVRAISAGVGIAYGNNIIGNPVWVAVGDDLSGNTIQYASDPSGPWSGVQAFGVPDYGGFGIAYGKDSIGNPVWVAIGRDQSGNNIQYASDPSGPWYGIPVFSVEGHAIAYGNSVWVAVGRDHSGNNIQWASDPSGPWTGVQAFDAPEVGGFGIAYGQDSDGNPVWVATGKDQTANNIQWATDPSGIWHGVQVFGGSIYTGFGITYGKDSIGNPIWVAVGDGYNGNNIQYASHPSGPWTGVQAFSAGSYGIASNTILNKNPYLFYNDTNGNEYFCIPGTPGTDVSGILTIPPGYTANVFLVGGGGGGYYGGGGSGGFHHVELSEGTYSYTIGAGGENQGLSGNPTTLDAYTALGGRGGGGAYEGYGGGGGNGGGSGNYIVFANGGGGGGDISGNIGADGNGNSGGAGIGGSGGNGGGNTNFGGGGGAVAIWGGGQPGGNGSSIVGGNGGGYGYCFGGGGAYIDGSGGGGGGGTYTSGQGWGAGGVGVGTMFAGGGGGGFDPRIMYIYANSLSTTWLATDINNDISGSDILAAFLPGRTFTDSKGRLRPVVYPAYSDGRQYAAPGAIFIVQKLQAPITTTTTQAPPLPCFQKGTRILTSAGCKRVEEIESGDHVVTSDGRSVAANIYMFTIDKTTEETAPYCIPAGALGNYLPSRDLHISGNHAIQDATRFWQIPKYLAKTNTQIQQHSLGERIVYYHVECPQYWSDNLIAEGVIAESFNQKKEKVRWKKIGGGYAREKSTQRCTHPVHGPCGQLTNCASSRRSASLWRAAHV